MATTRNTTTGQMPVPMKLKPSVSPDTVVRQRKSLPCKGLGDESDSVLPHLLPREEEKGGTKQRQEKNEKDGYNSEKPFHDAPPIMSETEKRRSFPTEKALISAETILSPFFLIS